MGHKEGDDLLISVIMPTYNRGYIIENAIQSVIGQTYSNWELIIVDDASADNTEEVINRIGESRIIYIKNEENRGADYSRNRGCLAAKGKYLAFLDSDNYWTSNKLEKQIRVLADSDDDVAFVFCSVEIWDEEKRDEEKRRVIPELCFDINDLKERLRRNNIVDTNTVLMRKEVFEKVGGFDEEMPRLQDWELFFRTTVEYQYSAEFIPEVMAYGALQSNSIGRDNSRYQDAMMLFMEKHINYLESKDIIHFIWFFYRNVKIYGCSQKCLESIHKIKCLEVAWESMIQLDSQTEFYETLFLWKEKMENSNKRTIFWDFLKEDSFVIGLYGLGRWGEAIYREMSNIGIKISYGIDKQVKKFHELIVVAPNEIPEDIDVIIVSVFQQYHDIADSLSKYYKGKIISIRDIVETI